MNCLKCGAVIPEGECFCEKCLAGMKDSPVPPDAVVQLPPRKAEPVKRSMGRRRQSLSPEEQIASLKKRLRRMYVVTAVLLLLQGAAIGISLWYFKTHKGPLPGQNYSTVTTTGLTAGK